MVLRGGAGSHVTSHQPQLLGVYRLVDTYSDRPVYKQDGGENYIYYRSGISYAVYILTTI